MTAVPWESVDQQRAKVLSNVERLGARRVQKHRLHNDTAVECARHSAFGGCCARVNVDGDGVSQADGPAVEKADTYIAVLVTLDVDARAVVGWDGVARRPSSAILQRKVADASLHDKVNVLWSLRHLLVGHVLVTTAAWQCRSRRWRWRGS